jgi:hypothetical protein
MVITFNKRELLEFSNYSIDNSMLPRDFVVKTESEKEWKLIYKFMIDLGWNIADIDRQCRYQDFSQENYFHVNLITKRSATLSEPLIHSELISIGNFRKQMHYEFIEKINQEHLKIWLRDSKGIIQENSLVMPA